jgi:hypothetical protein
MIKPGDLIQFTRPEPSDAITLDKLPDDDFSNGSVAGYVKTGDIVLLLDIEEQVSSYDPDDWPTTEFFTVLTKDGIKGRTSCVYWWEKVSNQTAKRKL